MSETLVGRPNFLIASKAVFRDIGALQVLIGGLMLLPFLVSLLYQEWYSVIACKVRSGSTVFKFATRIGRCVRDISSGNKGLKQPKMKMSLKYDGGLPSQTMIAIR